MVLTNNYQLIGEKVIGNAGYGDITLRLYARYISQSTENNSSPVQVELRHYLPNSYSHITYYSSSQRFTGEFKNASNNSTNRRFTPGETPLLNQTKEIIHEEDGSKWIGIGASFTNSYFGNTVTIDSVTVDLPKINRLNKIVVNGGELFSVDTNENVSNEVPVEIIKYVDTYTSKLKITMENNKEEQTVIRDYATFSNSTLTFTKEELTKIYNNTDFKFIVLILDLDSYDNGTKVGTYSVRAPATLSDTDLNPTFTTTFTELNEKIISLLGTSANTIVQNASVLNVQVDPVGHKGATITKVQIMHNQIPTDITTAPYEKQILAVNGVFDVTVTDSRENYASEQYRKSTIPYVPVDITELEFKRQSMTSSNLLLSAKIKYKQTTFGSKNNAPLIQYKRGSNGTLKTIPSSSYTIDQTNDLIIIDKLLLENIISYTEKDNLYLLVSDLITSDEDNKRVLKGIPTYDYGEHDFQVNGQLFLADENRENIKNIIDIMHPVNSLMFTMENINPSTYIIGTTWELFAKGKTIVGLDENDEDFNEVGKVGGEKEVTLTVEEMPEHRHANKIKVIYNATTHNHSGGNWGNDVYLNEASSTRVDYQGNTDATMTNTGGNQAHNNIQPYITCCIWKRTS